MEQKKMQMSQDDLYQYLTDHDVKLSRLAELMGKSLPVLNSAFRHHKNNAGYERNFSVENIALLNQSLPILADELRQCLLTFGSDLTFTNKHGTTYDPALLEPIKQLGRYLNLVTLTERILGWNKTRKRNVLADTHSKVYGCISQSDMMALNAELLSIAGVLEGTEVIPDDDAYDPEQPRTINPDKGAINPDKQDDKPIKTKVVNKGVPAPVRNEWDDTSVDLTERFRLFCQEWPDGILFFRVDFTYSHVPNYTVAYDHADFLAKSFPDIHPYRDLASGLVTAVMDEPTFTRIASMLTANGQHYDVTPMYEQ